MTEYKASPFILCVEDDPYSRDVLRLLLERKIGFSRVEIWETSEDFEDRINHLAESPELIFLDMKVAPYDGFAMNDAIKRHPIHREAKVIAVTANVMNQEVQQMQESGFYSLIGKPIVRHLFPNFVEMIQAGEPIWYVP